MDQKPTQLTENEVTTANKLITGLFKELEIEGDFELIAGEGTLDLVLDSPDNGIIIGYHGEVLEALQLIISLMVSKKFDHFVRVSIEVGDYKKNRSAYLEKLAMQVKDRVLADGSEQTIPQLKSWERRIVHMYLQDDKDVVSESVGEGKERVLVVKPRA